MQQPRIVQLFVVILLALSAAFLVDHLTRGNAPSESQTDSGRKLLPKPIDRYADPSSKACPSPNMETVEAPALSPGGATPAGPVQKGAKSNWVTEKPANPPIRLGWLTQLILQTTTGVTAIIFLL